MPKEYITRFTQKDLVIAKARPTEFIKLTKAEAKYIYGEDGVPMRRNAQVALHASLETIHIDDEVSQRSLFAQAVSAVNNYPKERRERHPDFNAIAYFTEPNGSRFLIGFVKGRWDLESDTFELHSVSIQDACDTEEEVRKLMIFIQHLNPGVPKIGSDSFGEALNVSKQTS
ncbi:MAG: hypothetical protein WAU07_00460 [Microgenomates group bacterium]